MFVPENILEFAEMRVKVAQSMVQNKDELTKTCDRIFKTIANVVEGKEAWYVASVMAIVVGQICQDFAEMESKEGRDPIEAIRAFNLMFMAACSIVFESLMKGYLDKVNKRDRTFFL